MKIPKRGEIWWAELDPTRGIEMKKTRPILIISNNDQNIHSEVIMGVPISSGESKYLLIHIPIDESSGLKKSSYIDLTQMRVLDKQRLTGRIGILPEKLWKDIFQKLNIFLGFREFLNF